MQSFMAFAAGYVTRPLGGILIGVIGDRIGRKCALWTSMLLMSLLLQLTIWHFFNDVSSLDMLLWQQGFPTKCHVRMCPTFLIGCLPTYAHVGWLSTAMLVVLRLLQGIAIGGEYVSALVFSMEHAPGSKKTISGALMPFGCNMPGCIFVPNRLPHLLNKFSFPSGCKGCLRFGLSVYNSCHEQKELVGCEDTRAKRGPFLWQLEPSVVLVWWRFYSIWCLKKQWMTLVGGFAFGWACWLVLWVYFSAARSEFGGKKKNPVPGTKWSFARKTRLCQGNRHGFKQWDVASFCVLLATFSRCWMLMGIPDCYQCWCFRVLPGLDRFQTQRSSFKPGSWLEIWWISILCT